MNFDKSYGVFFWKSMFFSYLPFKRKGFSGEKLGQYWGSKIRSVLVLRGFSGEKSGQYWSREGDFLLQVFICSWGGTPENGGKICREIFQAFEENSLRQRVLYELSGDACGSCGYLFWGSCGYNTSAIGSAAGTHIYNIVGVADNI